MNGNGWRMNGNVPKTLKASETIFGFWTFPVWGVFGWTDGRILDGRTDLALIGLGRIDCWAHSVAYKAAAG